ncbi:SdrD B-like domain-containing protein [Actinorhabdospora filicis]|nr:SdrD B-like domain-containing protein [Actinorhabdospora filicis]
MSGATVVVAGPGRADAAPSDGTLTVQVLRDFFGTGVINTAMDVPQQGMKVAVTDPSGHRVDGTTDATGKVVITPSSELSGGNYRVDVTIPAPYSGYLRAAPAAATVANQFDSFTSFVDVAQGKNASVITGVWNASDYALPDTRYFVPIQVGAGGTDERALVAFPTGNRGTCGAGDACPTVLAKQAQVGTTSALAYDRYRERLFLGAFARRTTAYGPEGGNAIYTLPSDGTGAPTLFAKVPGATSTAHDGANMLKDAGFIDAPGKESIGGLALSEDGSTLYAVNLLTRSVVTFDATGAAAGGPKATVVIPDPGCAASGDWRPAGLAVHDNALYVGGVCSAESTQNRADLRAVVYRYDGTQFTKVLTQGLDFQRGAVYSGITGSAQNNHWNPWSADLATWDSRRLSGVMIDPQPELASMAFARDGSMILGFRDRFMDVIGGIDPRPGNNDREWGMAGGDINMACAKPGGGYDWEGTGACPNHATPANSGGQPAGVVEYFHGDYFQSPHQESALGSVAYIPQQPWIISTEYDPVERVSTSGTGYFNVDTGAGPGNAPKANGYQFIDANGFGKAGGLGDIAYAAANAPIQIGNVVWYDGDHNGVQDAGQVLLPNATINLLDADGKKVATTKTDANGEYYFGGVGAAYELKRGAQYTVEFDVCTADTARVPGQPPAAKLEFTLPTVGDDRVHDSNVVPPTKGPLCLGVAPVTAPAHAGEVDHTIDAGVYIRPPESPKPSPPHALPKTGTEGLGRMLAIGAGLIGAGMVALFVSRRRRRDA